MHGLGWYDSKARTYDPILGMFPQMDPLAEKTPGVSPYAYCMGDPVKNVDPEGRSVWSKLGKGGIKIGKAVAKNGVKALGDVATYTDAISDVIEDVNTLTDNNSSGWEKLGAAASLASEALPVSFSDVSSFIGVISNKGDIASAALKKAVHGNSKVSSKAQHAYDIIDKQTDKRVKTGVSSGRIRKDGKSSRAEAQVRKWNKEAESDRYESDIYHYEPAGENAREKIYQVEKNHADEIRDELGFNANKNHISIPKGTKAKVIQIKGGGDSTILQVKDIRFECYLTKYADNCYVEAIPLNKDFEKVFSNNKVTKNDDRYLYGIKLYDLVEAVNDIYDFNNKVFAFEELKLITEKEAVRTYNQWYMKYRMYDK